MDAIREFATSSWHETPETSPGHPPGRNPSSLRIVTAILLLTAMGLLTAASVLASRPYQPAPSPKVEAPRSDVSAGSKADPC